MLSNREVEQYRELGYLVVPDVLDAPMLAEVRRMVDGIVADAGKVATHTEVYDLEDSHSSEQPRVRRIKTPHKHFPFFAELTRNPRITAILAQLLGPDIRLHGSKLNMKSAGFGAAVEWHQDWAFYPHTNDDVLAAGVISTTAAWRTGRCWSCPARTRGRCTIITPTAISSAPWTRDRWVGLFQGGAADGQSRVDDHPPRAAVHGSALNTSAQPRRLLLHEYRRRRRLAADGRRQFRGVQRQGGPRPADHRAANAPGAGTHAAAAGAVPGVDLREPARRGEALLCQGGCLAPRLIGDPLARSD